MAPECFLLRLLLLLIFLSVLKIYLTERRKEDKLLVAQLVEALHYKLEGRGFDFRWFHWNFSLT